MYLAVIFACCSNYICDVLRDLVPFVQFKKREKHPWKSVIFSEVAGLLKITFLHWCFSHVLNCANGIKSLKTSHMKYLEDAIMQCNI